MAESTFFTVGGTVQAGGGVYIPRRADEELLKLCQQGEFAYVLTPRQLGKSSLMMRTSEELRAENIGTAIIDLTQIGVQVSAEQWYLGLLVAIEDNLWLQTDVISWWKTHEHIGYTQRFTTFFESILLKEIEGRAVIFVDEIDTTLSLGFTDDFYGAIRYLYNSRSRNPELNRLSFVLIGVAMPGDLIADPQRTPFNVGRRVDLTDFTFEEAKPLADGFNMSEAEANQLLRWILEWTGGHPYLTQRLCQRVTAINKNGWTAADIEALVKETYLGEMSRQDNNIQFVRDMLTARAPDPVGVLRTYEWVWRGREVADEEQSIVKSHLKLSGVVHRENGHLKVRNQIYYTIFDNHWIAEHRPPRYWTPVVQRIAVGVIALLFVVSIITSIVALISANGAASSQEVAEIRAAEAISARETAVASEADAIEARAAAEASEIEARLAETEARQAETEAREAEEEARQAGNEAQNQAELAANALVSQLAAQSQVLADTNPQQSILLALEGLGLTNDLTDQPSLTAQNALYQALAASSGQGFSVPNAAANDMAANNEWLFTTHRDGSLRAWQQDDPTAVPLVLDISSGPIALSQDGSRLARGSNDGLLFWQTSSIEPGTARILLQDEAGPYSELLFSPDGNWLVTADVEGELLLWNMTNPAQSSSSLEPYLLGRYTAYRIHFDFESSRLAIANTDQYTIFFWNLANLSSTPTGETVEPEQTFDLINPTGGISFWPSSPWIIDGDLLWNTETGERSESPFYGFDQMLASPDGNWLVTLTAAESTILWYLGTQPGLNDLNFDTLQALQLGEGVSNGIATFSNDSRWLAVGTPDGRIELFDMDNKVEGFRTAPPLAASSYFPADYDLPGLGTPVTALAFSSDNQWLVALGSDGQIRRWHVVAEGIYDIPVRLLSLVNVTLDTAFLPGSETLVVAGVSGNYRNDVDFNPVEGVIEFWDTAGWPAAPQLQSRHSGLGRWVSDFAYSSDGNWFATAAVSSTITGTITPTIYLWSSAPSELEDPFGEDAALMLDGPPGGATQLTFTEDNNYLIASNGLTFPLFIQFAVNPLEEIGPATDSTAIYIWNLEDGDPASSRRELTTTLSFINRLVVSPDGNWLAVAGTFFDEDRQMFARLEVWDLTNLDAESEDLITVGEVSELALFNNLLFSANSIWLVAALNIEDEGGQVLAWNISEDNWTKNPPLPIAVSNDAPFSMGLSPNGRILAVANHDELRLYNPFNSLIKPYETIPIGDFNLLMGLVTFSPESRWIVVTNVEGSRVLLLDTRASDFERANIVLSVDRSLVDGTLTAALSPNNDFLVMPFIGSPPLLWSLDSAYVIELACLAVGRNLTLSEWEQYLTGLDYQVTCPAYPPDPETLLDLRLQADSLAQDGAFSEAQPLYEQVINAVLRSLDTELAIEVCNTAANAPDDGLVTTLLPACAWAAELALKSSDGTAAYTVCEAGQGNPETAAAVEPSCEQFIDLTLAQENLVEYYTVCIQGTESGGELAEQVSPVCEALLTSLPQHHIDSEVYTICLAATFAGQTEIATAACSRIVEIAGSDFGGIELCVQAAQDEAGQIAADICRASFSFYIDFELSSSLVPDCIEAGEIEVDGNTVHVCSLLAEIARSDETAEENNILCINFLQGPVDLAEEILVTCQAAVEMEPENGQYYGAYGVALALTGDTDDALEALNNYAVWAAEFGSATDSENAFILIEQVASGSSPDPFLLDVSFLEEQTAG